MSQSPTPPRPYAERLKDTPSDELIADLIAARDHLTRQRDAFAPKYPRACKTCGGVGLDLNAPTPTAGRSDTCPDCTGATPARHPLDTARQLSASERATASRHTDTGAAVMIFTLAQMCREMEAELTARGWTIAGGDGEGLGADYCKGDGTPH
jgi:hypothetical protein